MEGKPRLVECMLDMAEYPPIAYYVNNSRDATRREGWISAPRNAFKLTPQSNGDFHDSLEARSFRSEHGSPWVTIFEKESDAKQYGEECGDKYTVCEVTTEKWYVTGIVIVRALIIEGVSHSELRSELLVHQGFPIESITRGKETLKPPPRAVARREKSIVKSLKKNRVSKKVGSRKVILPLPAVARRRPQPKFSTEILTDEKKHFHAPQQSTPQRGYLVNWDSGHGSSLKPSWVMKSELTEKQINEYSARKKRWQGLARTVLGKAKIMKARVKEVLFCETTADNFGGTVLRYLVCWAADIQPSWISAESISKKQLAAYNERSAEWEE